MIVLCIVKLENSIDKYISTKAFIGFLSGLGQSAAGRACSDQSRSDQECFVLGHFVFQVKTESGAGP